MKREYHPSLPAFLFLILALLVPLFEGDSMVNADGDPARHVRHGETILRQHDVIRADSFTLTKANQPFVGFEYGSQVLLALSHRLGGTVGMAVLTTLIVATMLAMILHWLMRRGLDPLLGVLATILVAALTSIHWLARPHVFSWPLMLLLFFWLERVRRPPLWAFTVLFAFWANLHGAFVFGWIFIGLYLAGHFVESFWSNDREVRQRERRAAIGLIPVLVLAVLATCFNPYGWQLPWHVVEFFRDPWLRWLTHEFQSPDFLREDRLFLFSLFGMIAALTLRPRPSWTHIMVMLGTAGMALISVRNIVQFGLLAVPLLALHLAPPWNQWMGRRPFVQRFAARARTGVTLPYILTSLVLLSGLALAHGRVAGRQLVPEGFVAERFPVDAVAWARSRNVHGRMFHEFIWGGYLLYAWPEMKVFIDGGSDFYGGEYIRAHRHVVNIQPGWRDSLAVWEIELALVATGGPLTSELLLDDGWQPVYCDRTAVMLQRAGGVLDTVPRSDCTAVTAASVAGR